MITHRPKVHRHTVVCPLKRLQIQVISQKYKVNFLDDDWIGRKEFYPFRQISLCTNLIAILTNISFPR